MTASVTLRLYCHGLGDCNLVGLPRRDGGTFWILIDCGIHSSAAGGAAIMRRVVAAIAKVTHRLDVIVGTHEHWDHLSGFLQAAEQFEGFDIGEVWFSWAEDPSDADARRFDRYKADAAVALSGVALQMAEVPAVSSLRGGMESLLGFVFGAKGEKVRDARERLRGMGPVVRHLKPGELAPLPADLSAFRAYVLGPPRDAELLGIEDVPAETYGVGAPSLGVAPLANAVSLNQGLLRVDDDPASPFDGEAGARLSPILAGDWTGAAGAALAAEDASFLWRRYLRDDLEDGPQAWRRIDGDWLAAGAELALQLDSRTNNSSLVLAFEIVESGRVLLFAADAQVGNWLSWPKVAFAVERDGRKVTGADLVGRTVFYKVGHHGSRNATLGPRGLELMDGPLLVAFNPTDESLASKVGWKDFPAPQLTQRIRERSAGRYIQSDEAWTRDPTLPIPFGPGGALRAIARDEACVVLEIG